MFIDDMVCVQTDLVSAGFSCTSTCTLGALQGRDNKAHLVLPLMVVMMVKLGIKVMKWWKVPGIPRVLSYLLLA